MPSMEWTLAAQPWRTCSCQYLSLDLGRISAVFFSENLLKLSTSPIWPSTQDWMIKAGDAAPRIIHLQIHSSRLDVYIHFNREKCNPQILTCVTAFWLNEEVLKPVFKPLPVINTGRTGMRRVNEGSRYIE